MCFGFPLHRWSETTHSKNSAIHYHGYTQVFMWGSRYSCLILMKTRIFSTDYREMHINSVKIRPMDDELFHEDVQTWQGYQSSFFFAILRTRLQNRKPVYQILNMMVKPKVNPRFHTAKIFNRFIYSLSMHQRHDVSVNLDAINLHIVTNNQLGRTGKTKT